MTFYEGEIAEPGRTEQQEEDSFSQEPPQKKFNNSKISDLNFKISNVNKLLIIEVLKMNALSK